MNIVHELLLERQRLLADGVKEKANRLYKLEDLLKDAIDDNGHSPIVDEELGVRVSYHLYLQNTYDPHKLALIVRPEDYDSVFETVVRSSVLKALVDRGLLTKWELDRAIVGAKPIRGPIQVEPVGRGR